jgi:hypothetical protein
MQTLAQMAEVMKIMEYVRSKEESLIQIVRTQQHHANLVLHQTVKNYNKSMKLKQKNEKYNSLKNGKKLMHR